MQVVFKNDDAISSHRMRLMLLDNGYIYIYIYI